MLELAGGDEYRGAGGEADDDRVGDEVHQRAETRQPHGQLDGADHEGEGERIYDIFLRSRLRQHAQRREHDDGRGGGRSRDQVAGRAEQGGDDGRNHGGVEAVDRRHAGKGRKGDPLRQNHHGSRQPRDRVGAQRAAIDLRPPTAKRYERCPQMLHAAGCSDCTRNSTRRRGRRVPRVLPAGSKLSDACTSGLVQN